MTMRLRAERQPVCTLNENESNATPRTPTKQPAISPKKSRSPDHLNNSCTTPSKRILSFDMKTPKKGSPYSATKSLFYRSMRPTKLAARDPERQVITRFIEHQVENHTSCSMYISGNPGTGKSALIDELLQTRRESFVERRIKVVKINCMSVVDPKKIYNEILLEIGLALDSSSSLQAQKALQAIRTHLQDQFLFLILDEIDQLARTGDNNILYSIFDWTCNADANVGLIAISNTLDFTDRMLPRLQAKNGIYNLGLFVCVVEPELVHFGTYTVAQIGDIINAKLVECIQDRSVVNATAVELAARKIAACGDLRKALDVVRHSLTLAERESTSVTVRHVLKALECLSNGGSSKSSLIKDLSLDTKVLLHCLSGNTGHKEGMMPKHQLYQLYQSLPSCYSWLNSLSRTEFDDLLTQLESKGLVSQSKLLKDGSTKITAQFTSQELSMAIQDCSLLKSINMPVS